MPLLYQRFIQGNLSPVFKLMLIKVEEKDTTAIFVGINAVECVAC